MPALFPNDFAEITGPTLDRCSFRRYGSRVLPRSLTLAVVSLALVARTLAADPEKSVIHITTFRQEPLWESPWRFDLVRAASGSGFVIKGKRIMTNAHVVSWGKQIIVYRYQDPRPYMARVAFIGQDCDLALLEVEDERFFDGLEPLEIGTMPKVRSTVVTYGYPAGGKQISYTRGVVSRIEVQSYEQSGNRSWLAVQTDAAINPGNSGGPVIQDDKVVGVAFQGMPGLENAGFFIPPPIIEHFLKDVSNGTYEGFPQAGINLAPLENQAYRKYLGLPDDDKGARVDHLSPYGVAKDYLKPDDVLLQIGKYPVGSDGTIVYDGNRVHGSVAFSEAQSGDKVPIKIWRNRSETNFDLPVLAIKSDRPEGNQYEAPRYYIYGGMVFTPLCRDYLRSVNPNSPDAATSAMVYELYFRRLEKPETSRKEPIVLAAVLPNEVNASLDVRRRVMVDRINGKRIEKLEDVIDAFENNKGEQDIIEFMPDHHYEALDRAAVARSKAEILDTYNVPSDRRL